MKNDFRLLPLLTLLGAGLLLSVNTTGPARAAGQAPLPTASANDTASLAVGSYILGPNDQLSISVLGHTDLAETVTVLPDGMIRYPIIGAVHAAGMTVDGLTRTLTSGLSDQLNQPQVTVSVMQSRPSKISVLGAVKSPGQYDVLPGTHLLDVLAACGGPAQDPSLTQATLVVDNGRKSMPVDVSGLMAGTDTAQNIPLQAGDVLLVQARDPSFAEVQVTGEVGKPGAFPVPTTGDSVVDILNDAGGPTAQAALTHAQILHDGQVQTVNLRPLQTNLDDPTGKTILMPGDVLMIPTNKAQVAVLGDVHTPGTYPIPDGGTLNLIDAMTVSGGPAPDADSKKASILRRNAAGTLTVIPINVDALLKGKAQTADNQLKPGDILYVPTKGSHSSPLQNLSVLGFLAPFLHL
jgi:polysaccharide export outer membrane protein